MKKARAIEVFRVADEEGGEGVWHWQAMTEDEEMLGKPNPAASAEAAAADGKAAHPEANAVNIRAN